MWRAWVMYLSPFVVMGVCRITSILTYRQYKPKWSWVPTVIAFWTSMGLFIFIGHDFAVIEQGPHVLGPRSWIFLFLSLIVGLIPLPILIGNWRRLATPSIVIAWLVFGLVNPMLEETYWRGMLSYATSAWMLGTATVYTSVLFSLSHSVEFGRVSPAMSDRALLCATFVMGLTWSLGYIFTHTLWFAVASHIMVDLGNLAVPVYMRLYLPPHLQARVENSVPVRIE